MAMACLRARLDELYEAWDAHDTQGVAYLARAAERLRWLGPPVTGVHVQWDLLFRSDWIADKSYQRLVADNGEEMTEMASDPRVLANFGECFRQERDWRARAAYRLLVRHGAPLGGSVTDADWDDPESSLELMFHPELVSVSMPIDEPEDESGKPRDCFWRETELAILHSSVLLPQGLYALIRQYYVGGMHEHYYPGDPMYREAIQRLVYGTQNESLSEGRAVAYAGVVARIGSKAFSEELRAISEAERDEVMGEYSLTFVQTLRSLPFLSCLLPRLAANYAFQAARRAALSVLTKKRLSVVRLPDELDDETLDRMNQAALTEEFEDDAIRRLDLERLDTEGLLPMLTSGLKQREIAQARSLSQPTVSRSIERLRQLVHKYCEE